MSNKRNDCRYSLWRCTKNRTYVPETIINRDDREREDNYVRYWKCHLNHLLAVSNSSK